MADCIGTGFLQFPCPLVQMRYSIGENGCGHILMGGGGNSGGKEGSDRGYGREGGGKGEKVGDMYKASCHTGALFLIQSIIVACDFKYVFLKAVRYEVHDNFRMREGYSVVTLHN